MPIFQSSLVAALPRWVDGKKSLSNWMPSPIFDAALEELEAGWFSCVGVVKDGPLTKRRAIILENTLDHTLKQRVPRTDEFQIGVADDFFLVEGNLLVDAADLAVLPLQMVGQLSQLGLWHAAWRWKDGAVARRSDCLTKISNHPMLNTRHLQSW
jgi:hypothetical protein